MRHMPNSCLHTNLPSCCGMHDIRQQNKSMRNLHKGEDGYRPLARTATTSGHRQSDRHLRTRLGHTTATTQQARMGTLRLHGTPCHSVLPPTQAQSDGRAQPTRPVPASQIRARGGVFCFTSQELTRHGRKHECVCCIHFTHH